MSMFQNIHLVDLASRLGIYVIGEIPKYGVRIQDPLGSTMIITWSYIIILVNKLITSIN